MPPTQQPCLPQVTAADDGHEPWRRATQPPYPRAMQASSPVPALLAKPPPLAAEDWDLMFKAVVLRLRAAAQAGQDSAAMTGRVLECAEALEQLYRQLESQRTPGC